MEEKEVVRRIDELKKDLGIWYIFSFKHTSVIGGKIRVEKKNTSLFGRALTQELEDKGFRIEYVTKEGDIAVCKPLDGN